MVDKRLEHIELLLSEVEKLVRDVNDDVVMSIQNRERLRLIVTSIGVIGIFLWVTVVGLYVSVHGLSARNAVNQRIGKELLQQSCFAYYERTHTISPICKKSDFVQQDGSGIK